MTAVRQMVHWMDGSPGDGSLGNLLQCQSLDVPQTVIIVRVEFDCLRGQEASVISLASCLSLKLLNR